VRRAGRTTTGQAKAFELLGPRYVLPYHAAPLDLAQAFGSAGRWCWRSASAWAMPRPTSRP
jgi:tRNA (guanine-N7-)-methyltransferase